MASARIDSLPALERAIWEELARAAATRGHAWRTMTLATVDGERAEARSVVLRELRPEHRRLVFYTDARSPKAAQLRRHPLGTLLMWSADLGWQLRLRVRLALHDHGPDVEERWERLRHSPAAQDYLSPLAPGAPLGPNEGDRGDHRHFALVEAAVEATDWLELHPEGHRRAVFDGDGGRWVQP